MRTRFGMAAAVLAGVVAFSGFAALPSSAREDHGHEVALRHGKFDPAQVEVEAGETVTWVNEDDDDPQSVTADDRSFDSHPGCSKGSPGECMGPGEEFRFTFPRTGRFPYHSRTEGGPGGQGMSGVVIVVEAHGH